jgi:DNA-binding transcriptional LysR family regulator
MKLTSAQLALLVEIERTGGLARAALRLEVSPPAISQQLARIEKEVGLSLVDRGARGARLTPLGRRLAQHGKLVADELERARRTVAEFLGAHAGRLRVGAPPSISVALLPDILAALRYRFPQAELSVIDVMSDAGAALVAEDVLDVAFGAAYGTPPSDDRVTPHHVFSDPLLVVLPDDHPLAGDPPGTPVRLDQLAGEDWVSGPRGRPSRVQLDDAAAECGFLPRVPFQTESYDVAQALAGAGVAIALVPRLALSDRSATKARPLARPVRREVYALLPRDCDHVPLARQFLQYVTEAVASGVGEGVGR